MDNKKKLLHKTWEMIHSLVGVDESNKEASYLLEMCLDLRDKLNTIEDGSLGTYTPMIHPNPEEYPGTISQEEFNKLYSNN